MVVELIHHSTRAQVTVVPEHVVVGAPVTDKVRNRLGSLKFFGTDWLQCKNTELGLFKVFLPLA